MAKSKIALTAAAIGFAALLGGLAPAEASPMSASPLALLSQQSSAESGSLQKVHYRYCRRWRHECADRWGWRTGRYFRCLARHGC